MIQPFSDNYEKFLPGGDGTDIYSMPCCVYFQPIIIAVFKKTFQADHISCIRIIKYKSDSFFNLFGFNLWMKEEGGFKGIIIA